ncbi:MAG: type II secretion system F family protein, partial [Thermotoga sp.]
MPFYRYVAFDGSGRKIKGVMEAESELRAANVLGERGLAVVSLKEVKRRKTFVLFPISTRELASFSRQLATMISAGVRIKEALTILARQEMFSRRFRKVLLEIIIDLETGSSLAEALSNRRVFDPVFINLVAAGEEGGVLDKSMEKAAEFYESSKRLQDEIKSAMAYPTFVLVFAIIIVMVISFYILPNLIKAFGGEVPLSPTVSFLMNVNRNLKTNWPVVSIVAGLVIIGFVILMKSKAGIYIKD